MFKKLLCVFLSVLFVITLTVNAKVFALNDDVDINMDLYEATPGDLNDDGKFNLKDLVLLAQFVANWKNISVNEFAADVNGDELTNLEDVTHLAQYLAGWKVELMDEKNRKN